MAYSYIVPVLPVLRVYQEQQASEYTVATQYLLLPAVYQVQQYTVYRYSILFEVKLDFSVCDISLGFTRLVSGLVHEGDEIVRRQLSNPRGAGSSVFLIGMCSRIVIGIVPI